MATELPRIASVEVTGATTLRVQWADGAADMVDLAGWVATGSPVLDPLSRTATFAQVRVGDYGASLEWGDDDDLAIDAVHLHTLALAQRPFTSADLDAWQKSMNLSNREAADFFQMAVSRWEAYRAGAAVPARIAMLCRAAERDPILMQAYYRPRKPGRRRAA
ncbi:DUF2442 domain-containing protein [Ancylobacter sp. 6x-1]|uniref:DUF2442 domain-containing protein n=1 Tax=Ancylobacter crimeensis TaxID=2579147 RepID=A0ABT0DCQ4_9HYPH|nr:DUF2442 domain-containing protein [Ancylobacter crimeensis]MCK0197745.1 DUF2442 domain-containing protein [Ancylobacter crimeensis]